MKKKTAIIFLSVAFCVVLYFYGRDIYTMTTKAIFTKTDYDSIIESEAQRNGIDPNLIRAVIMQESSWRADVMGFDGLSIGLMQITKPLAQDYFGYTVDFPQFVDPAVNIAIGAWDLGKLFKRYGGDLVKTLWAYNMGAGNVEKGKTDYVYSDMVLSYYREYSAEYTA